MLDIPIDFYRISKLYANYFDIVRADTPALLDQVFAIRYQVYCVENPFEDPAENLGEREMDADDDRAAHILLIHRETGEAAGTARVIFPEPHRPLPIEHVIDPAGRRIYSCLPASTAEISRFAVSKAFRRRRGEDRYADIGAREPTRTGHAEQRVMPFITFGLMRGIVGVCLESGITNITAVMEPPLIRLLKRFGLNFRAVGGLVDYHGIRQPCVACLRDLIDHGREEASPLWLYAQDEVARHSHDAISTASLKHRQRVAPGEELVEA